MKQDNKIYAFIGFIIGIIPYIILMLIINDKILNNILSLIGIIIASINGYIFYKETKKFNN